MFLQIHDEKPLPTSLLTSLLFDFIILLYLTIHLILFIVHWDDGSLFAFLYEFPLS